MQNREFDTSSKTKQSLSRQVVEHQRDESKGAFLPQRSPFEPLISGIGDASSAGLHAFMLNRATNGQPSRAGQSLLRLQKRYGNRYVQRVLALAGKGTGEAEVAPEVEQSIQQARGGGHGIDSRVRGQMESSFGADFSNVRVHTNSQANMLNRELSSRAFATGQDIFFRQGAYNPGSSSGRELIAHELTHVVQQNGGKVQSKLTFGQRGDKYEQEADRVAREVMQRKQQPVQGGSGEGLVRRQAEEEEEEEEKKPAQMKREYSQVQRQAEEENEEEKPIQAKAEDVLIQRQIKEEEEGAVQVQQQTEKEKEKGLNEVAWRNKIDSEIKIKGNKYRIAIVNGLLQASLPAKYDDGVKIFLEELQKNMAKYSLGLILENVPGGGAVSAFVDSTIAAQGKIEAKTVKDAFSQFKTAVGAVMQKGIDQMTKSGGTFNIKVQNGIIEEAHGNPSLNKIPITRKAKNYVLAMQEFIEKKVNQAILGSPEGNYADILNKVNDYIQRSWQYFILARLEVEAEYKKCKVGLMKPGSACDNGFWSWELYDQECLHEKCKQWLVYSPMPPDWSGSNRQEYWGMCGGQACYWFEVSTDVKHPAGVASVEESRYKREKERYKK
jgi:hypothetical protein